MVTLSRIVGSVVFSVWFGIVVVALAGMATWAINNVLFPMHLVLNIPPIICWMVHQIRLAQQHARDWRQRRNGSRDFGSRDFGNHHHDIARLMVYRQSELLQQRIELMTQMSDLFTHIRLLSAMTPGDFHLTPPHRRRPAIHRRQAREIVSDMPMVVPIGGSNWTCPICLDESTDEVRNLPCDHMVHNKCVQSLIDHRDYRCPMCRRSYVGLDDDPSDEQQHEQHEQQQQQVPPIDQVD